MSDFKIPHTYRNIDSNYLTLPPMIKFCKEYSIYNKGTKYEDYIEAIEKYANINDENLNQVLTWGNLVLKQGIKQLFVTHISIDEPHRSMLQNTESCTNILNSVFGTCLHKDLFSDDGFEDNSFLAYNIKTHDDTASKISLTFIRKLLEGKIGEPGHSISYPVFVDIDLIQNIIVLRAKPKSRMFEQGVTNIIDESQSIKTDNIIDENQSIKTDNIIHRIYEKISEELHFQTIELRTLNITFKNALYNFVEKLTFTPKIIEDQINEFNNDIENFISNFFNQKGINYSFHNKAVNDLRIFIEKYLSITCKSEDIFTNDRDGYPIQISTTDHEKSKMKESSAQRTPLQEKEIFFDNKKSMQHQKSCDSIKICYHRLEKTYYGSAPFVVSISVERRFLTLNFTEYVEEGEIQNVLHQIIRLEE